MPISIDSNHLETVKRILDLHFNGLEVLAYGSRVSGVNLTPDADLDIVVVSEKPISLEDMISVEKAFAETELPFRVDIVDWAKLPESLQKQSKKNMLSFRKPNENLFLFSFLSYHFFCAGICSRTSRCYC